MGDGHKTLCKNSKVKYVVNQTMPLLSHQHITSLIITEMALPCIHLVQKFVKIRFCAKQIMSRIMYELEVCSDGTTEAQPRSFRQNRPTASTLSDIMQVQHMSRKIREKAEAFPYLAKL